MNLKRIIPLVLNMVLGIVLIVCNLFSVIDSFWGGMGYALLFVGALRLVQIIRYKTDAAYKEQTDTATGDERNHFLRMKAWSWAGYLFILTSGVGVIAFKILDMEREMMVCSYAVCLMLVLYWVSYFILRKKY